MTTKLTKAEKARLRELCEKATPGPWVRRKPRERADYGDGPGCQDSIGPLYDRTHDIITCDSGVYGPREYDADFIASSRTAIPALLDENDELRAALRDFRDNWDCDLDSHRHGTPCRCCAARALLADEEG